MRRLALTAILLATACGDSARPNPPSTPSDAGTNTNEDAAVMNDDAGIAADAGTSTRAIEGKDLFEKLAGLWSGPATRTRLGDFAMMSVDFRAATDQFMFGRVDIDEDNALRFGLSIETHGGNDVVTYRNGGYFLGMMRDDRTELVEHDPAEGTYRFCHVERGCDYIDAVYDFSSPTNLIFDVYVNGVQHVYWDARRTETRELPENFIDGLLSQGTGNAPFPAMPNLRATVTWTPALTAGAPIWVVLAASGCSLSSCRPSRHIQTIAPSGSTSAEVFLEQVHAGDYDILAVIDRNENLDNTMLPDRGDSVSFPARITIAPNGETTATANIAFTIP